MGKGRIVSLRDKKAMYDVLIDRRGDGFGNPFHLGRHGTRLEVVNRFEDYARGKPDLMARLPELAGKVMGCWCAPLTCHGEAYLHLLRETGIESGCATLDRDLLASGCGVIVHQVNCRGVMGAGLALAVRKRYPLAYETYMAHHKSLRPGMIQMVKVAENDGDPLYVCNLAGQDGYGRDKAYTDYDAVAEAFAKLSAWAGDRRLPVYVPEGMGSALAGGDWSRYAGIIWDKCPRALVCRHGK